MSCEFCERADFGNYRAEVDNGHAHISLAGGSYRFPKNVQFAFCPMCGAALSDPRPLTLDELRERDGRPVYTKTIGVIGSGRWEFIAITDTWVYLKTAIESYKMTALEFVNSYGKSWFAFDREPKEDGHES